MSTSNNESTTQNLSDVERMASLLGGGALVLYGLSRRSWSGLVLALAGGGLVYRGATGHCGCYEALGIDAKGHGTAGPNLGNRGYLSRDIPGHGGILVEKNITINRPREELYHFWRDFENLPSVMSHLETVTVDGVHSHWVAKAPAGQTVAWDAEIIRDNPNELIAWRSLEGSTVEHSGSVRFKDAPQGRGTEVRVIFEYRPPGGALGAMVAKLFHEEPHQQVEDDLHRFKQMMEAGETATVEGQPRG